MQRLASWLIALLALAVFAAAGYVVTKKDTVPDAGMVPPMSTTAAGSDELSAPSSSTATSGTSSAPSTGSGATRKVIAFLGDDWTAGIGASPKNRRFSTLLAGRLGLTERNFGADGTGYAKTSDSGGAYDSRVEAVAAARPDIVVVSGGRNDTSDYEPTLRARVRALFATLHAKLPAARIIALAPMWGDSDMPPELDPVSSAVKQYVAAAGGSYLDVPDPIHDHPEYMKNASDPNNQGYAAIAAALAPRMTPLLP